MLDSKTEITHCAKKSDHNPNFGWWLFYFYQYAFRTTKFRFLFFLVPKRVLVAFFAQLAISVFEPIIMNRIIKISRACNLNIKIEAPEGERSLTREIFSLFFFFGIVLSHHAATLHSNFDKYYFGFWTYGTNWRIKLLTDDSFSRTPTKLTERI